MITITYQYYPDGAVQTANYRSNQPDYHVGNILSAHPDAVIINVEVVNVLEEVGRLAGMI